MLGEQRDATAALAADDAAAPRRFPMSFCCVLTGDKMFSREAPRELVDDVRQIRDRYLHSRRFYVNIVLALPLCSSYIKPLARATAVVRSLRAAKCKPTLLSLRGTLQRVRDVAVAVELVELATVLLYATLLTLVLAGARWAPAAGPGRSGRCRSS